MNARKPLSYRRKRSIASDAGAGCMARGSRRRTRDEGSGGFRGEGRGVSRRRPGGFEAKDSKRSRDDGLGGISRRNGRIHGGRKSNGHLKIKYATTAMRVVLVINFARANRSGSVHPMQRQPQCALCIPRSRLSSNNFKIRPGQLP